jgi:pilus assembly protein Flp/PilA
MVSLRRTPTGVPPKKDQGETRMLKNLKKLMKDDQGATAVEYGLIVAAIAGLIIVVVFLLGNRVNNAFNNVAAHMP